MVAEVRQPDETIGYLVAMVRRRLNLLYADALRPIGITTRQFGVLSRLWREDGQTVDALVLALYTDQSSLSRVLDRMVKAKLVVRRPDPLDKRVRRISLTGKGRGLERPVLKVRDRLEAQLTRGMSRAGFSRMQSDLRRLLSNLAEARS